MQKEVHETAAKEHLKIAEEYDRKMQEEAEMNRKTGLRAVASQNYFYAGINAVEAVLAAKQIHSFSHESRNRNMAENPGLFSSEIYGLYNEIERDIRNKVAYRGTNGKMYEKLKEFACLANKEAGL